MSRFMPALVVASFISCSALAADQPPAAEPAQDPFTIDTATCRDIFDLYEDAVPAEGKDPADLEDAQDTILLFVVWVHGYLSGRDGINRDKRPLSKEGVETTVKDISVVCKPDESKLFLDVVDNIK